MAPLRMPRLAIPGRCASIARIQSRPPYGLVRYYSLLIIRSLPDMIYVLVIPLDLHIPVWEVIPILWMSPWRLGEVK